MGEFFDKKLEVLGGTRVYTMGVGNSENLQTEEQFDQWKEKMWGGVVEVYRNMPGGQKVKEIGKKAEANELPLEMIMEEYTGDKSERTYEMAARQYMVSKEVEVHSIKELRQNTDEGSTLEVVLSL